MTKDTDPVDPRKANAMDPDRQYVPPELLAADGQEVSVKYLDENGDEVVKTGVLAISPAMFRYAEAKREEARREQRY